MQVTGAERLGDQLKVAHALADARPALMRVDDARERLLRSLTARRFAYEVVISRKNHAFEFGRALEQGDIRPLNRFVVLRRQHIHPAKA